MLHAHALGVNYAFDLPEDPADIEPCGNEMETLTIMVREHAEAGDRRNAHYYFARCVELAEHEGDWRDLERLAEDIALTTSITLNLDEQAQGFDEGDFETLCAAWPRAGVARLG